MRQYRDGTPFRLACAVCVVVLGAIAPSIVGAQADSGNTPFVGLWKLNPEKSHLRNPAGGLEVYREYENQGNGWMFHTVVTVSARGANFLFAAARYDGRQYPVWDSRLLGLTVSAGRRTPRTVEFDRISAHQFRWTDRTDGQETQGGICTVSQDGRTLTITAKAPGQSRTIEQVFDRVSTPMPALPAARSG